MSRGAEMGKTGGSALWKAKPGSHREAKELPDVAAQGDRYELLWSVENNVREPCRLLLRDRSRQPPEAACIQRHVGMTKLLAPSAATAKVRAHLSLKR